ncbi:MAG TPA: penicillin acylase family protein, partial [Pyrinomonadaceae bacterium]
MTKYLLVLVGVFAFSIIGVGQAQRFDFPSLKAEVTVHRDKYSRPYIKAANDSDLYFVQGYVTASDRLWQMDLMRRVARGRTAELFGSRTLEEDKRWRRLGFAKVVEDSIQHLSPELRSALDSYAAGVNAYIASLDKASLPVEFKILQYEPEKWTPQDSLIIGKILADSLSTTWRTDLLKASLLASLPKDKFEELAGLQTEYDVILFGKDLPVRKSVRVAEHPKVSDSVLAVAHRMDAVRESSLSRIGLFAE